MNLYLLRRLDRVYHDESRAHVVVHDTEAEARALVAATFQGDSTALRPLAPWQTPDLSTCELLGTGDGPARIVLTDYLEA